MADVKISALTAASTPLAGTEVLPIVQSGVTKKVSVADLTAGRATAASSITSTTFVNLGPVAQRGYQGTGALTVTATFNTTLNGNFWRNAIVEVVFHGIQPGADTLTYSRYYIPVQGILTWNTVTPVKVYGSNLTITQTATTSTSVTFTVVGGSVNEVASMYVLATANNGVSLS